MDVVSHAAWGATVVRDRSLILWAAFTGALPDLIPAAYGIVRYRAQFFRDTTSQRFVDNPSHAYMVVYRWSHSILPISIVTLFLWLLYPAWVILVVPYYLHILLDVPTHSGIWATRPFYPLSDAHIEGKDWWKHVWISASNWSALALINIPHFIR